MLTYGAAELAKIAESIGVPIEIVEAEQAAFEGGARWYRLDRREPKRTAPSSVRRDLAAFRKALGRVVAGLESQDIREALEYRAWKRHENLADDVRDSTVTAKFDGAVSAVYDLVAWAGTAKAATAAVVRPGHADDAAINDWIAAVAVIYSRLTGRTPGTSVGATGRPNRGKAGGPFIRFIQACAAPLGIALSNDAWRDRLRTLKHRMGKSLQKEI